LGDVLGEPFAPTVAALLPNLGLNFYVKKKIIANSSIKCAKNLITNIPSVLYVPVLLDSLNKQQQLLRARSTEFLTIIIPATKTHLTWTENDCALLNHIESAIRNAACDKSSDVRKEAYPLYNAYKNTWPKRGEAFFSTLDMRTKKVLTNVEEKPSSPKVKKKKKTKRYADPSR
jgi:hypothetical protein